MNIMNTYDSYYVTHGYRMLEDMCNPASGPDCIILLYYYIHNLLVVFEDDTAYSQAAQAPGASVLFGNTGQQRLYERVATSLRNFHSWSAIFVNLLYICSSFTQWLDDLQEAVPVKFSGSRGLARVNRINVLKNAHFEDL